MADRRRRKPGRPPKAARDRRDRHVKIMATQAEARAMASHAARLTGGNVSDLVRAAVREYVERRSDSGDVPAGRAVHSAPGPDG